MTGLVAMIFCLNYFKWLCVDPRNIYFVSVQPHQKSYVLAFKSRKKTHFDPEFPVVCEHHVGRFLMILSKFLRQRKWDKITYKRQKSPFLSLETCGRLETRSILAVFPLKREDKHQSANNNFWCDEQLYRSSPISKFKTWKFLAFSG